MKLEELVEKVVLEATLSDYDRMMRQHVKILNKLGKRHSNLIEVLSPKLQQLLFYLEVVQRVSNEIGKHKMLIPILERIAEYCGWTDKTSKRKMAIFATILFKYPLVTSLDVVKVKSLCNIRKALSNTQENF